MGLKTDFHVDPRVPTHAAELVRNGGLPQGAAHACGSVF